MVSGNSFSNNDIDTKSTSLFVYKSQNIFIFLFFDKLSK